MANTTTRAQLRTRARQLADRESSTFVSDTELNTRADVSASELHDILVTRFEDYFESKSTIVMVSGTSDYALPTDFYKDLWVDFVTGSKNYTMKRYMNMERNRRQFGTAQAGIAQYRIIGSLIRVIPTPGSGSIVMGYVPQYAPFTADSGAGGVVESAVPQGWEEYIVADMAMYMLNKEESDISAVMAIKMQLKERIEIAAEDRDTNEPIHVVDVSGRFRRTTDGADEWGW